MYDGEEHSEPSYTVTYGDQSGKATNNEDGSYTFTLSTGDVITITDVKTVKNVSDTKANNNTFTYVLANADQYASVSVTYGTLTITARSITMTSATDTKKYDGTALTNSEVKVTGDGFVTGESAAYDVTGSQTLVGSSDNEFTYELNEGTLAENYSITTAFGKLTVTKTDKVVTILSGDNTWEYDGKEHSEPTYTVTFGTGEDAQTGVAKLNEKTGKYEFTLKTGDVVAISDVKTVQFVSDTAANNNTFKYTLTNADQYETVTTVYGTLTITAKALTITADSDRKVYDGKALTANGYTNTALAEGDAIESVTVTGSQTVVGKSDNVPSAAVIKNADGTDVTGCYTITYAKGSLEVTELHVTVSAADAPSVAYDGKEHTGVTEYTLTGVVSGQTATITYTPAKGTLVGTYTGSFDEVTFKVMAGKEDVTANYVLDKATPGKISITDEGVSDDLVVTKTAEDKKYALDETVTFEIEVTNIYNEPKTIILKEIANVTLAQGKFENVAPGKSVKTTATYKITEADILKGSFTNTVTATVGTKSWQAQATVKTVEPDPSLKLEKETTSKAASEDGKYALGEEITYKITVMNDGNLTISDIEVKDSKTGDTWTIDSLAPGESKEFTASYTVTEEDILNGSVKNEVTATGVDPTDDPVDPDPDDVEDPTEDPKPHLTVDKETTSTPANGKTYALGEKVTYKITVTNDGNLTITEIKVTDELTGDVWTIDSLAVGKSAEFTAEHAVTEDDILAGKVVNEATAEGKNPSDNPTEIEPGTKEDPTEDKDPHLTVEKETTSTPANGKAYQFGEKVTYKITVTNDGNLTITEIKVTDDLTGDAWTIEALKPGESKDFKAEYTVTKEAALAGSVKNTAKADGKNPSDEPTKNEPGTKEDPTGEGKVKYWFSEGVGQTWWKSSGVDAKFTISRDPFDEDAFKHFLKDGTGIEIDGKVVDPKYYTAVSGSVKLSFTPEFMETLEIGRHTIKGLFDDGEAETYFFVASKDVPDTGDHNDLFLWSGAMITSMLGMIYVATKRRKEEQ